MELNREQIIKALECCHSSCDADCKQCTYRGKADDEEDLGITCINVLIKDTLSLIKELTEENERLLARNFELSEKGEKDMIAQLIAEAKSEAIIKMHSLIKERCIKGGIYPAFVASTIEKVAKELLRGD